MGVLHEFREFAVRGSVVDLAVGVVVGVAFGKIIDSLVKDVIMPPIGLALGKTDFTNLFVVLRHGVQAGPYPTLEAAQKAGAVTLNVGVFLNTVVSFMILAFAIFLLVKAVNALRRRQETAPKEPPEDITLLREIRDALKQRS